MLCPRHVTTNLCPLAKPIQAPKAFVETFKLLQIYVNMLSQRSDVYAANTEAYSKCHNYPKYMSGKNIWIVCVQLKPVSLDYLKEHQVLLLEFQNATHWPKHLLVQYSWKHTNPINATAGLYLIFISGTSLPKSLSCSHITSMAMTYKHTH